MGSVKSGMSEANRIPIRSEISCEGIDRILSTISHLLDSVPPEYLPGLQEIVLCDSYVHPQENLYVNSSVSNGNLPAPPPYWGLYYRRNARLEPSIHIFVGTILRWFPAPMCRFRICREAIFGHVLFHEIGHHIHRDIHGGGGDPEKAADQWQRQLNKGFMLANHPWLWRILRLSWVQNWAKRWRERYGKQDGNAGTCDDRALSQAMGSASGGKCSGIDLFEQGELEEAYLLLENAVGREQPPGLATLYFACLKAVKTLDRTTVDKVITQVHGNVEEDLCEQCWGATLFDLGYHEEGIQHLRLAVQLKPGRNRNRLVLADRLRRRGNDEALKWYESVLTSELGEGKWSAYRGLAHWYLDSDPKLSVEYTTRAIELNPYNADLHYLAACGLIECDRRLDAIDQFQAAVDLGYDVTEAAFGGIAECYRDLGQREKAVKYAKLARKANPQSDYVRRLCAELGCTDV